MAVFLKLNGQTIQGRIDGLEAFTTTLTMPEGEHTLNEVTASNDLTFYDDGWDIINTVILSNPQGLNNYIHVQVFDDCCEIELPYQFIIRPDMCTWCEGYCHVTTRLVADDPDRRIVRNLQETWIGNDSRGFFTNPQNNNSAGNQPHPQVALCNEIRPDWLAYLMVSYVILAFLFLDLSLVFLLPFIIQLVVVITGICLVLAAIAPALNAVMPSIIRAINNIFHILNNLTRSHLRYLPQWVPINIPFSGCASIPSQAWQYANDLRTLQGKLVNYLFGCGRVQPSPLVRGYMDNAAGIAGATGFSSTILNNPGGSQYHNLVHFFAPVKKGFTIGYTGSFIIQENLPGKDVMASDFLDMYAELFNAKWWVTNGVLYFERKDYWQSLPVMWDYTQDPTALLEPICYSESSERFYAAMTAEYDHDYTDKTGNESWQYYQYHINYALTYGYNAAWKDCDKKEFRFGTPRFRSDGIEQDPLDFWSNLFPWLDQLVFMGAIGRSKNYLLMEHSTTTLPKSLIWDDLAPNPLYEATIKLKDPSQPISINNRRNYGMEMDVNGNNTLFDFHKIDDPTVNPYRYYTGTAKVKLDCLTVSTLSLRKGIRILRYNAPVVAEVTQISIDWSKRMVEFQFKTF